MSATILLMALVLGQAPPDEAVTNSDKKEFAGKQLIVELVKRHEIDAFPEYDEGGGFDYTSETYIMGLDHQAYAVRPLKQQGELTRYDLTKGKTNRLVVPQPKPFKADTDFRKYFDNPVLSVNSGGDLFCRWTIRGNGDHALALLKKGSDSFLVKRVKMNLADCFVVPDLDGIWHLVEGGPNFTVYQVDKDLNLTRLGDFSGRGFHTIRILDARFISKGTLHLFWGDVISPDNYLRMRCVDFDVRNKKWLHNRELFRLDKFVSSANEPSLLQHKDDSIHYLWRVDEGAKQGESIGLYYQAEANGRTVKVSSSYEYRAITDGDRIVVCYTLETTPEKVYFRIIQHGSLGLVSEIVAAKGRKHNLWSKYMVLYSEADRIWFVNTLTRKALYELRLSDEKKP